jgi:hypothetical protein
LAAECRVEQRWVSLESLRQLHSRRGPSPRIAHLVLQAMAFAGDLPGFAGFDQQHPDGADFRRKIGVER